MPDFENDTLPRDVALLIHFRHRLNHLHFLLYAARYDPAKDSAVTFARAAARDPNFSADYLREPARDLTSIPTIYGGQGW